MEKTTTTLSISQVDVLNYENVQTPLTQVKLTSRAAAAAAVLQIELSLFGEGDEVCAALEVVTRVVRRERSRSR